MIKKAQWVMTTVFAKWQTEGLAQVAMQATKNGVRVWICRWC